MGHTHIHTHTQKDKHIWENDFQIGKLTGVKYTTRDGGRSMSKFENRGQGVPTIISLDTWYFWLHYGNLDGRWTVDGSDGGISVYQKSIIKKYKEKLMSENIKGIQELSNQY